MNTLQLQFLVLIFAGWVDRIMATLDVTGRHPTPENLNRDLDFRKDLDVRDARTHTLLLTRPLSYCTNHKCACYESDLTVAVQS